MTVFGLCISFDSGFCLHFAFPLLYFTSPVSRFVHFPICHWRRAGVMLMPLFLGSGVPTGLFFFCVFDCIAHWSWREEHWIYTGLGGNWGSRSGPVNNEATGFSVGQGMKGRATVDGSGFYWHGIRRRIGTRSHDHNCLRPCSRRCYAQVEPITLRGHIKGHIANGPGSWSCHESTACFHVNSGSVIEYFLVFILSPSPAILCIFTLLLFICLYEIIVVLVLEARALTMTWLMMIAECGRSGLVKLLWHTWDETACQSEKLRPMRGLLYLTGLYISTVSSHRVIFISVIYRQVRSCEVYVGPQLNCVANSTGCIRKSLVEFI